MMRKRRYKITLCLSILLFMWFAFALPTPLFDRTYSKVLYDKEGHLLGAQIASDEQWRFAQTDSLPAKFETCLLYFEDQYFYKHIGINPISIIRAAKQNMKARKVVSGASTLTMQVIRLSRYGKKRSIKEKLIEMILAVRLELSFSKKDILNLYASQAPFGGNTVSLEAAAWRYFGTHPKNLSWGESAMLAVLPNQPSLIYPGKHNTKLIEKRNKLLSKLLLEDIIDTLTYQAACLEPIPDKPKSIPRLAPHLLTRMIQKHPNKYRFFSSIDITLQETASAILQRNHEQLSLDQINNGAILIAELKTGKILAYLGNTNTTAAHHNQVDIITAVRSPGSTLKPFLYAASLDNNLIMPQSLLPDIPTYYTGFSPKNFSRNYDGVVPVHQALARSLNIPFVRLLDQYSYPKFNGLLKQIGFTSLIKPPEHYGLSVILGGAEVSLWELSNAYALMSQTGLAYQKLYPLNILFGQEGIDPAQFPLSGSVCWHTLEALMEVNRPEDEAAWKQFTSSQRIAWKTGTSIGFKDAWAIGTTPDFLVGVWVGNADGEGRPNIIGSKAAAPILFDIFNTLESRTDFTTPNHEFKDMIVCTQSGLKANPHCPDTERSWIAATLEDHKFCNFHQMAFINQEGERVLAQCADMTNIESQPFFILPPIQAVYYKKKDPTYVPLPKWSVDCVHYAQKQNIELIYPGNDAEIFIPLELDGQKGRVVFELAHHLPDQKVYWHLDNKYLGSTEMEHKLAAFIPMGTHNLVVIDELGERLEKSFEVLSQ